MQRFSAIIVLFLAAELIFAPVFALDVNFKGTLIDPPACTINNGGMIDVDFGDRVGIKKVNGINYRQRLNYQLHCASTTHGWDLVLTLKGNAAVFDELAIQTNQQYLGIRLYLNDSAFKPESQVIIDPENPPILEAVPVAQAGMPLTEGAFLASATLLANYQ
ncbi:TPA: fimbrial protein [Serratia marcescens]